MKPEERLDDAIIMIDAAIDLYSTMLPTISQAFYLG
jgi:hypothetical protein